MWYDGWVNALKLHKLLGLGTGTRVFPPKWQMARKTGFFCCCSFTFEWTAQATPWQICHSLEHFCVVATGALLRLHSFFSRFVFALILRVLHLCPDVHIECKLWTKNEWSVYKSELKWKSQNKVPLPSMCVYARPVPAFVCKYCDRHNATWRCAWEKTKKQQTESQRKGETKNCINHNYVLSHSFNSICVSVYLFRFVWLTVVAHRLRWNGHV